MKIFNFKISLTFWFILILVFIASLEFSLLLRHKSPYLSDSYFYNHIFYRFEGYSYNEARFKVLGKLEVDRMSDLEKNIFSSPDRYDYSLSRYLRRPLYPFLSHLTNRVIDNEYRALITPIFLSFLGSVVLIFLIFNLTFERYWAGLGSALFLGFYPFIDWSTYFLTDTIGLFFWLLLLFIIFKYMNNSKITYLFMFVFTLLISLLNREQGVLLPFVFLPVVIAGRFIKKRSLKLRKLKLIFFISVLVSLGYILINYLIKQPGLYDSWIYLESNFGENPQSFSLFETLKYLAYQVFILHKGLVSELARHRWWSVIVLLGFVGFFQLFFIKRKPKLRDLIMVGSALAAYVNLIIVPYLSYRYFYPAIISIIYFAIYAMRYSLLAEKTELKK